MGLKASGVGGYGLPSQGSAWDLMKTDSSKMFG
jgi:hypothetical protein